MKSILDPSFRYTSSVNTDIAKTFARIRREQKAAAVARAPRISPDTARVLMITETRRIAKT